MAAFRLGRANDARATSSRAPFEIHRDRERARGRAHAPLGFDRGLHGRAVSVPPLLGVFDGPGHNAFDGIERSVELSGGGGSRGRILLKTAQHQPLERSRDALAGSR